MTEEKEREENSLNGLIGTIGLQLKALVEVVQELSDVKAQQAEDQSTYYSAETTDPQEMQRLMKSNDMLLALNEIVNGEWQKKALRCDAEFRVAVEAYRDEIFEILQRRGIVLDELL